MHTPIARTARPTPRNHGVAGLFVCLALSGACASDEPESGGSMDPAVIGATDSATTSGSGITQPGASSSDAAGAATGSDAQSSTGAQATTPGTGNEAPNSMAGSDASQGTDAAANANAGSGAGEPADGANAGSAGSTAGAGAVGTDDPGTDGMSTTTPAKSAGCGKAPPASDTSIMVGSANGSYILDVPSNYDNNQAYPLVFSWHGSGVANSSFHQYLNLSRVIGDDAILVTPECLNGGSTWPNDASYFDALLEHFSANYCIDTSRVFSTGHSMGGMHTALLGCLRGDVLRGDAVLAAPHRNGQCVKGNMAAMMSVGMSDFIADTTAEFSYWAMYGGCDTSMQNAVDPTSFYGGALDQAGTCVDYGGCAAGTPVRTCTFEGGHEIPPWVAAAVWDFFKNL